MKSCSAAVIGLGSIGQGYDYDSEGLILTHARAFARHPGFELLAGVDPDANQRERFERQYHLPTSPDAAIFAQILAARPKAVLCEKPLAQTLADAQGMVAAAAAAGCALAV